MTLELTGAGCDDGGPAGCVARFLIAADAQDGDACRAELHETSRAAAEGPPAAPPMRSAAVGTPSAVEDRFEVPVDFVAEDGTTPRFVFVVRPADTPSGLGIDLEATMHATFGGDPAQLLADAMQQALAPIGEAMEKLGEGIGAALSGLANPATDGGRSHTPGGHPSLPPSGGSIPALDFEVVQLDFTRSLTRPWGVDPAEQTTALRLRCRFALPEDVTVEGCAGITIECAEDLDGEDLRPEDAYDDLGATTWHEWDRQDRNWSIDLQLRAPRPSFRGLARFSGWIRLQLPSSAGEELQPGRIADLVDRSIRVESIDAELRFGRDEHGAFTIRTRYGALDYVDVSFVDEAGQTIPTGYSGVGDGETSTRDYGQDLPPHATVLLRTAPPGDVVEVPFSTRALPLALDGSRH